MQLRSGIKMMPQGLDRSQGLRNTAGQAESLWSSTDQSPDHFAYFDTDKTTQQIESSSRWPMQLRSGIKMMSTARI